MFARASTWRAALPVLPVLLPPSPQLHLELVGNGAAGQAEGQEQLTCAHECFTALLAAMQHARENATAGLHFRPLTSAQPPGAR